MSNPHHIGHEKNAPSPGEPGKNEPGPVLVSPGIHTTKEPLNVVFSTKGWPVALVPETRRPSGPPSIVRLVEELELEEDVRNAELIALYRRDKDDQTTPDAEIAKDYEEISKLSLDSALGDRKWETDRLASAIARTHLFKADEESGFPVLPIEALGFVEEEPPYDSAFTSNILGEYLWSVLPTGEAPKEFHLAALLSAVGTAAGRNTYYTWGSDRNYLNTWHLLVASTAVGKSEAAKRGMELLADIGRWLNNREIRVNRNFKSAPALLNEMKWREDRSHPTLHYADEILTFIDRIQSKQGGDCIGMLNEAYDSPLKLENITKNDSIKVPYPFLCILGCGVPEQVAKLFSGPHEVGGFVNRWSMFVADKGRPHSFPPPRNEERWNFVVRQLAEHIYQCQGEITITAAAKAVYEPFHNAVQDAATSRARRAALKYACLFAVIDGVPEVDVSRMTAGLLLAFYNVACVDFIRRRRSDNAGRDYENEFVQYLRRHPRKQATVRDFYTSSGCSVADAKRAAAALEEIQKVRRVKGHPQRFEVSENGQQSSNPV